MDPQAPASFIPKRPFVEGSRVGTLGLFTLIGMLIFAASMLAAGGAFAYGQILKGSIARQDASLKLAEGAFDQSTIKDLMRLDSRLTEAQKFLGKHVAPSGIFTLLANLTLTQVQLTSFSYALESVGSAKITLSGIADSFSTLALQSDQMSASKLLKDIIFSGITTNSAGRVVFSVSATVDPSVISYNKNLQGSAANQTATSTP